MPYSRDLDRKERDQPRDFPVVHPGGVLRVEFMEPLEISQNALARAVGVPPRRVNEIVRGKRAVTADTALRLGRYFGTTPEFWINLQTRYDLETRREELGDRLRTEVTRRVPAC